MLFRKRIPLENAVWAVIDCETSGLDARSDRLLSVAAIEVRDARIVLDRAYAAVLRQAVPSLAENIVIHGIGGEAQLGGRDPAEVAGELGAFVGESFPAAFHAPFDRAVLERSGMRIRKPWLDLARVLPALFPDRKAKLLDGWLDAFGIECPARHDALADAWVTAQLLLVCLAEARRQGLATVESLRSLEAAKRWIG